MIDLHVRVEELAAAMGAAGKDDFIGDAHGYLRVMDEKNARPLKWQGIDGRSGLELLGKNRG